ncbi:hypothetical protein WUBG_07192 [Wuchereria bancrofti]|uniref:Uncharacterized protein n=1 Tax=Wuchereria bancrofti TaxID=6293 RepID=J9EI94_WUCBA|nr:hypothetical protein WUBG_07192 [Wuchereria bancrofti]
MFVKRYSFNTSAAIKRDDEIRIPLHITLNQGLVSEPELFPPLSPTTRNIDFKTSKLLKINLTSYIEKYSDFTSTDAKGMTSSSDESAESSEAETVKHDSKFAISTTSKENASRNSTSEHVYSSNEASIEIKLAKDQEKSVNSKSFSEEQWDKNTGRLHWYKLLDAQPSKKDDPKAIATDLNNVASISWVTAGHETKGVEEVNTSEKLSAAPYKPTAFFDTTDSREKSLQPTAVQDFVFNVKLRQNYFAELRSKINVRTPDDREPVQPRPILRSKPAPQEQRLHNSCFEQRHPNLPCFENQSQRTYTDEELCFMTEGEQIMAACGRSIADQLRPLQNDSGTSVRTLQENDEEKFCVQYADEVMSQSSDTEEDLEMDIAVVHFSRWFKKKEIEHSVDKVIIQKLPFQFANAYLNVRAKKVTKAKAYLEKFENKRREFGGEGMSRPYEPFKNVLLNTKSNDSSVCERTNQSDEKQWTAKSKFYLDNVCITSGNTDDKSDSRREKCLIRNRPATPPELSHHTKHMGTYSGGHTFVVSDNQLPQFKQAMNETEMTSLENKYSTTAARPIMLLSIKSPSNDKDSKMPVKPLSATNMDFDVKITGNSDEESSEGSSISDDLQGFSNLQFSKRCCR